MIAILARVTGGTLVLFTRFITAVRANWAGIDPVPRQRVYYANHSSNADFMLIWGVLPPLMRGRTRPVAAADYWLSNPVRRFIARHVIDAVLMDRRAEKRERDPIEQMAEALDDGASLIIFPEGGRNRTADPLLPFKAGLFNLAKMRPEVDLVPVWIENLNKVMPAGEIIPIPLVCSVTFGAPIHVTEAENKDGFLARAAEVLEALAPERPNEVVTVPQRGRKAGEADLAPSFGRSGRSRKTPDGDTEGTP